MFQLFAAVVEVVVEGLVYFWQNMLRRVFDVKVTKRKDTFTAGCENQCICRIEVEIRDDEEHEQVERFTRPETYKIKRYNQIVDLNVSENVLYERANLIIKVYARLTVAGIYTLIPIFNDLKRINLVKGPDVRFDVQPSEANSLKVTNVKQQRRSNATFNNEEGFKLYNGGMAQIFVEVMDEYGNTVKDEELKVANSSYVDYISCDFDEQNCRTLVTVFCRDVGKTFLILENYPQHIQKRVLINIVPAPMAPERCSLRLETNRRINTETPLFGQWSNCQVVAGQPVKLKVELNDIYNNPFKLEDRAKNQSQFTLHDGAIGRLLEGVKDEISADIEKSYLRAYGYCCEEEERSTGYSTWFLDWIPQIAGKRLFSVCVDGKQLGTEKVHVDVLPGPPKSLQTVCAGNDEAEKKENSFKCYTNEKRNISFKGFDEFGNAVQLDADQWYLEVEDDNEIITEKTTVGKNLLFTYSFQEEGTYSVLVATKIQSEVSVPEPFLVKVIAAPLDHTKCKISTETPLFGQMPTKVKLRLELFDCNSMPYHSSKLDRNAFEFKVNGVSSSVESREPIDSSEPNVTYFNPCVNIEEDIVNCFLKAFYKRELLGIPLQLNVAQILPYREKDYLSDVEDANTMLYIYNMTKAKVIGEDYSNLENINRILRKDYDKGILSSNINPMDKETVSVDLSIFESTERSKRKVRELFSYLIEGLHYRNQASQFNKQREEWKSKSIDAYSISSYEDAKEYSEIKEKFGDLMNSSNRRASDAMFKFFNHGRQENEIDLHGQLVADESKLNSHRMQLLEKQTEDEVQEKNQY